MEIPKINLPTQEQPQSSPTPKSRRVSLSLNDHLLPSKLLKHITSIHHKQASHPSRKRNMERVFQRPSSLSLQKLKEKYGLGRSQPHLSKSPLSSVNSVILGNQQSQQSKNSSAAKKCMPSIPQIGRNRPRLAHKRVQSLLTPQQLPMQAFCQSYQFSFKFYNGQQVRREYKGDRLSSKYRMKPVERVTFKAMIRSSHRKSQLERQSINSWRVGEDLPEYDLF